ncbi:MAG: hypothetical protein HN641_13490 [Candidatus Marinimicrobia bacterium]|nr:hypothetical protein [Candidatus Neomarinimicrobiota bacterium]
MTVRVVAVLLAAITIPTDNSVPCRPASHAQWVFARTFTIIPVPTAVLAAGNDVAL